MTGKRRTGGRGAFSLVLVAIVVLGALATAGLAGAASGSVHVKVTKKAIVITGSRATDKQAVQINYDPNKCGSYATEVKRNTEYSDFPKTKAGAFTYKIKRSGLHLSKPAHYACVFLIALKGSGFVQIAAASAKL
jgi:hypothetical protein